MMEYQYNHLAYLENLIREGFMTQWAVEQAHFAYVYMADDSFLFLRVDMRNIFVNGTN